MRKLATIQQITGIYPIENADAITQYEVNHGWKVVDSIGKYEIGDLVVYFEIDSWIPHTIAHFLSKGKEPRVYNQVSGERLRTLKLRGALSQGLIMPLDVLDEYYVDTRSVVLAKDVYQTAGEDVTEVLGIQLYEPPVPAQLQGQIRGQFPSYVPKTDQERVQNLVDHIPEYHQLTWEVTEKLDGTSASFIMKDGEFQVCSRNLNLKETEGNTYWKVARQINLEDKLRAEELDNLAIQGEIIGEGIQGNKYKLKGQAFYCFDIYDIKLQQYLTSEERLEICEQLDINHVPVLGYFNIPATLDEILQQAEGKSILNPDTEREGLVFKQIRDGSLHFKAISNKFLLKDK